MLRKLSLALLVTLAAFAAQVRAQVVVITPSTTKLETGGGSLTFTATVSYSTAPAVLAFSTSLPAGWTYLSSSGAGSLNSPPANTTGALNWFYTTTPASPATFTFTASYPAGLAGLQPLTTSTLTRDAAGSPPVTAPGPTLPLSVPTNVSTWTGTASNDWSTAGNWTPTGVPNSSGATTFAAQISSGTPTVAAGTSITLNSLLLLGGTLNNLGTLTLKDTYSSWAGGIISGAGQLINSSSAVFTASGSADHDFNQQTITNQSQFIWTGAGNLRSGGGGGFVNAAGAVFSDASATGSTTPTRITATGFAGNFTFTNAGTYQKTGAGETKIEIPFANSGAVVVLAGNLHFNASFAMSSGIFKVGAGAITQLDSGLNLAGGTLIGGGTVQGNVTNGAATGPIALISPGDPVGTLTIQGSLTLLQTSQLLIDLSSTAPGVVTYDFLNVSGPVQLGGLLTLNLMNNARSVIQPGDSFIVLSAASGSTLAGAFLNAPSGSRLMSNANQGSFLVTYSGNNLMLSGFNPIPEPSTWALLVVGAGALALGALRRRR